ncbi:UNVERIFIED_CONTAM: hypothetical protein HHA_249425 [Hammondia hammondi]|eukprot:XP_008883946.1 hypothetical protein HHA_249425 [Hammondia hammondi]
MRSISSCISRAQLLLGQITDAANSQLESGAANGVHHLTEVGQTVSRASLEEYMAFQEQLTPHQDDDEISFGISQDSESEGVTSPVHEDSRVRSIGPIGEPEPLSQPPEFASVVNAKWEIREATDVRPPSLSSTVPHDQLSTAFCLHHQNLLLTRRGPSGRGCQHAVCPPPPPSRTARKRLAGTCAGRRATPLKANASCTKLWAAGGVSRATVETVVSGVGARSRSSVGAASWTAASSTLSRTSIGSKTRDSSVELLPGDRVLGAPPRGRSRKIRPLAQQARGSKASGETPAVFQRLWEGAMERQRARSRDAPVVSGASRLAVPRLSLGSSTGSNNSSPAQRRSFSEKDANSSASTLQTGASPPPRARCLGNRRRVSRRPPQTNATPRTATQTASSEMEIVSVKATVASSSG